MRFKLKRGEGSVATFTDKEGKTYFPGDVVTLPLSFKGEAWLESVDIEPVKTVEPSKPEAIKPILEHPEPIKPEKHHK